MTPQEFCLLLVSVVTAVAGQFCLKLGALKLGRVNLSNGISHVFGVLTNPTILVGLSLYAVSAVLYILLLTRVKLSVAAPAFAVSYIFSVLIGYFIFRESISLTRILGLGLIASGVTLVVWQR